MQKGVSDELSRATAVMFSSMEDEGQSSIALMNVVMSKLCVHTYVYYNIYPALVLVLSNSASMHTDYS